MTAINSSVQSNLIPQEFLQSVIERSDLYTYASQKIILKKATSTKFKGLCPFHNEKTPSFYIHNDKQYFHCFGCGANGNIITLKMKLEQLPFRDAVEQLANPLGLELPTISHDRYSYKLNKMAYLLLSQIADYFANNLQSNTTARKYLQQRSLSKSTLDRYKIGFSFFELPGFTLNQDQFTIAQDVGVISPSSKPEKLISYFRNRIIFPIRDIQGRNIGFGGRTLGESQPKYLNSKESDVFHKSHVLYGIYEAKTSKLDYLIIVEGYMDVLSLAEHGIDNAVATLGTAITTQHIQLLFRYTKKIAFCFDGDQAGRTAAWKACTQTLAVLTDGIEIKFIFLPGNHDPDSLIRQEGKETFKKYFSQGMTFSDYFFTELERQFPLNNMEKKASFGHQALELLGKVKNCVLKQLLIRQLEQKLAMPITESELATPGFILEEEPKQNATPHYPPPDASVPLTQLHLATCLLIQNPAVIATDGLPAIIKDQPFLACDILNFVVDLARNLGCQTTGAILEASRHTNYYAEVQKLAIFECQITTGLQNEFTLLINTTELQLIHHAIETLLHQARDGDKLNDAKKLELQRLLSRKALLKSSGPINLT